MIETTNLNQAVSVLPPVNYPGLVAGESPTDHLITLPGGNWKLWRCFGVRGAGFPSEQVLTLGAAECAAAADVLLEAQEQTEQLFDQALTALRSDLEVAEPQDREPLLRAIQTLKKGKLPKPLNTSSAGQERLEILRTARAQLDPLAKDYRASFLSAIDKTSRSIRELIADDRFRCAVTWQNRQAVHTSINSLLRKTGDSGARGSKQRQHEEMVASYLQRYCVKNDTIGFFGPMGWGTFLEDGRPLEVRPGETLLAKRNVRFEGWCIDRIAETLAQGRVLDPWLSPRRLPYLRLEGTNVYFGDQQTIKITPKQAFVLHACDGRRTARQIATGLLGITKLGFRSEKEIFALLDELQKLDFISWDIAVPLQLKPEEYLRRLLESVDDSVLRAQCLGVLNELEQARDQVIWVADDPEGLDEALSGLETTFTRLTGALPTRKAGQTYAGRTLIYEDCRRDIEIEAGPDFLEKLGPPLSLLLTSARWLTYQAGKLYRRSLRELYSNIARRTGSPAVDAITYINQLRTVFGEKEQRSPAIESVIKDFHERWAKLLAIPPGQRRIRYSCDELRGPLQEMFDAPSPGWTMAGHHSPDIMIVASSAEAIKRGDYELVMGEVHVGANTLKASCFVAQHPDPDQLTKWYTRDLPEPQLIPVASKEFAFSRAYSMINSLEDFRLLVARDTYALPGEKSLPISSLVVEDTSSGLRLRTRDGKHSFEILEACSSVMVGQVIQRFGLFGSGRYNPRVNLDNLVVARETRCF
ncbi:MAG TPA: lantibiotic dehydratase, partial [Pyrinomonadaceae bacterium]|nr:lantibiotic dehydratase [Pyrinomonadaceae bacterium]